MNNFADYTSADEIIDILSDLNQQIEDLLAKKQEAELALRFYNQQLLDLHSQHRTTKIMLRRLTSHTTNMWENIGDGG